MCASREDATLLILRGNMKTGLRVLIAAAFAAQLVGARGAWAQDTTPTATTASPQPPASGKSDVAVGPAQLQDFSLSGKVTRQSDKPVAVQPVPKPKPAEPPQTAKVEKPAEKIASVPAKAAPKAVAPASKPSQAVAAAVDRPAPQRPVTGLAAGTAPAGRAAAKRDVTQLPTFPHVAEPVAAASVPVPIDAQHGGPSLILWILAAIAVGAGAGFLFYRQRPRRLAGVATAFDLSAPAEAPVPPPAAAPRAAAPAAPAGIVSTRLRPWVEVDMIPARVIVDDQRVVVEFGISIFNSGSAHALDLLVEGAIFNAGPSQDQQIRGFFDNPVGEGQRIPSLAPMQRIAVKSAVSMTREQFRALEMEGRPLVVPMVAFNALYRWGSGEGRTSASYLVGRETEGEKLAPFRLDLEPRVYRRLAKREHDLRVKA